MFLFYSFSLKNLPGAWKGLEGLGGLFSLMPHPGLELKNIFYAKAHVPDCPSVRKKKKKEIKQNTNIIQGYFKNSLAL